MSATLVLIGCGNMGFAMLEGWIAADPALKIHVVEPASALRERAAATGAAAVSAVGDLPSPLAADLVVLAVKPQMIAPVLGACGALAAHGACFVSVAAGIPMAQMIAALPEGAPIIRCMPNTPASIRRGMMVLCAGESVSAAQRDLTERLFAASGAVAWIDDEGLMDAVTAISGSGPAYVFHFIEALTEAARALGLPADIASLLAQQTVAGAAEMALKSDTPPDILREQVTSPGGTTAAALGVMMADERFAALIREAAIAARDRGVELGRET